MRTHTAFVAFVLVLVRCAHFESATAIADAGLEGGDADPFSNIDAEAACVDPGNTCSADMQSIVDCHGHLVHTCDPSQGCAAGACVAACDAAVANKSSVGCDFFAHNPFMALGVGCFALFVSNTWSTDVAITGDVGGVVIDLSKYTYLSSGTGKTLTMTPIGAGGKIPVGKVGLVFLRDGYASGPDISTQCGFGVTAAETDPNAATWTDPIWLTGNEARALHVVTSSPVTMYDILPFGGGRSQVTDAALVLPTSTWDTSYIAITPRPMGKNETNPALSIIAETDATTVTINPTVDIIAAPTVAGTTAGTPIAYTLDRGQVLRLDQPTDLLGSIISSDKPVGVWAEQACIDIDADACDGAHEQIPPVRALGSEYVYGRYRNRVDGQDETPPTRITGAVDGTILTWDPSPTGAQSTIGRGESFEVRSSGPFVVSSQDVDHPFYLATYMTGGRNFEDGNGDPEFVGVVPSAQYLDRYVFFSDPTYPETNLVYIRKKGTDNAFHDVTLDCAGTLGGWQSIGASGKYEITWRDLVRHDFAGQDGCDNGAHETHSDGPFTMTVWGWGTRDTLIGVSQIYTQYTSYAYPAGAGVQSINSVVVAPK